MCKADENVVSECAVQWKGGSESYLTFIVHLSFLFDVRVQLGNIREVRVRVTAVGVGVALCGETRRVCNAAVKLKRINCLLSDELNSWPALFYALNSCHTIG